MEQVRAVQTGPHGYRLHTEQGAVDISDDALGDLIAERTRAGLDMQVTLDRCPQCGMYLPGADCPLCAVLGQDERGAVRDVLTAARQGVPVLVQDRECAGCEAWGTCQVWCICPLCMPSDALPVSEQIRAWIALHPVMALLNVERIYWCWSVDKSGLCSLTDIQTADTGQAEVYREGGRYHVRHYYVAKSATAMQPAEYAQDDVWQGVDADDCLAAVQGLGARGL